MATRFFARVPVVVTAARSGVLGAFPAAAEPALFRRGSKNFNWYYRALEKRKTDATIVAQFVRFAFCTSCGRAVTPSIRVFHTPRAPFPEKPLNGKTRSRCYLDVAIGHDEPKRIVVELAVRLVCTDAVTFMSAHLFCDLFVSCRMMLYPRLLRTSRRHVAVFRLLRLLRALVITSGVFSCFLCILLDIFSCVAVESNRTRERSESAVTCCGCSSSRCS